MRVAEVLFYLFYDFRGYGQFLEKVQIKRALQPMQRKTRKREAYPLFL